jgi:hypothetical protein
MPSVVPATTAHKASKLLDRMRIQIQSSFRTGWSNSGNGKHVLARSASQGTILWNSIGNRFNCGFG